MAAILREGLPLLERFALLLHGEQESEWISVIPDLTSVPETAVYTCM